MATQQQTSDDPQISAGSRRALSKWNRPRGKLDPADFSAMLEDGLLELNFKRGHYRLTKKGRQEYVIVHGEPPRRPGRRPSMVQWD